MTNCVLIVSIDPFFNAQARQITALAAQHLIPAVYYAGSFMLADGLASYGGDTAAHTVWRVRWLKGFSAARNLKRCRFSNPSSFKLVINLKTASAWSNRFRRRCWLAPTR